MALLGSGIARVRFFCKLSLHTTINVTLSYNRSSIRFLDLELYRAGDRIGFRPGFKATDSFRALSSDYYHPRPPHVFNSIIFGNLYRFITHSYTYHDFLLTKHIVQKHWRAQGYSRSCIRSCAKAVLSFTGQTPHDWRTGFFPCSVCKYCKYGFFTDSVFEGNNAYPIVHRLSCSDASVIYLIVCKRCNARYVGETGRRLRTRVSEHVHRILNNERTSVAEHFNSAPCSLSDFSFTILERATNATRRKKKEERWMRRLNTLAPNGLNILGLNKKALHLVVPYSTCADKVVRVCQRLATDVTTVGAFTSARNLRSLFTPKTI